MCWIGKTTDKKIAKKNVLVYKILDRYKYGEHDLLSPSMKFNNNIEPIDYVYKQGKINTAHIGPQPIKRHKKIGSEDAIRIDKGIHCYSTKCTFEHSSDTARNRIRVNLTKKQFIHEIGTLHFYEEDMYYDPVIVLCTIPKGTTYYQNNAGEIVTEKLITNFITGL